jgi:tetratricopeptide (TPR) repeat protein
LDKFEYKASADEIKALIAEGEYAEAAKIADKIDWRRVRSVMMLCTISDLYKINRRFQESKDILLLAYEKHPTGRLIIYSLCELCIKMGEYDQASEYYKEFVQIAPRDTGRYVLQYRLYEALDVSIEERIAILEEFKKREPREKWVYELAYLYHRIGLTTKCVEECDEMFLWFGEGRYVIKALELKALHQPLSQEQQEKYDTYIEGRSAGENVDDEPVVEEEPDEVPEDTQVADEISRGEAEIYGDEEEVLAAPTTELPEVKTVDVGQYNTINLQMALAESMKEVLSDGDDDPADMQESEDLTDMPEEMEESDADAPAFQDTYETQEEAFEDAGGSLADEETAEPEISETKDPIPFERPKEREQKSSITDTIIAPLLEETAKLPNLNTLDEEELQTVSEEIMREDTAVFDAQKIIEEMTREAERLQARALREQALAASKPTEYDKYLAQEYDGQISFVLPDAEKVEKQITGQLSIDDIMAEWEQMKKNNQEKRMEDVRQHIMAQTGSLFANFDEATKNGLLEELEKAFVAAIMKESSRNPHVKRVVFPDDMPEEKTPPAREKQAAVREIEEEQTAEQEPEDTEISADTGVAETEGKTSLKKPRKPVKEDAPAQEAEEPDLEEGSARGRELSPEEQELFGKFVHQRKSRKQLIHVLDNMSLASCTGNIIITGEEEDTAMSLAKALIREMQYTDSNFSGKVAKIEGHVLNKKDVEATFSKLDNGALIIVEAARLKTATVASMIKVLEKENMGLLALLVGTKTEVGDLLAKNGALTNSFNLRVDIEPLDNEALVAYAKQYAEDMEYSIDEFGILALHTRIADRQTSDHEVTVAEVRDLVDEAIEYANKKTPKHFMDILLAKRYDEEDMIILREKDFMHY